MAGFSWVQMPVADYLREFERVGVLVVAALVVAAVSAIGAAWIVGVVLGRSVDGAFVVVTGYPVQRCLVICSRLSYG